MKETFRNICLFWLEL